MDVLLPALAMPVTVFTLLRNPFHFQFVFESKFVIVLRNVRRN